MKRQAITLGRVGILLPIASFIPVLGQLAGIAALVLLLISHNYFSKIYEEPGIFKNALIGFIVQVGGSLVGGIIFSVSIASATLRSSGGDMFNMGQLRHVIFDSAFTIIGSLLILAGIIIGFYYLYKALISLAEKTNVKYFKTAGLLYFIGAIGMIVFFLGSIVIFVAWIFHIIAYFSIPQEIPEIPGANPDQEEQT